ncbi:MAG: mechanosensitive ion channel family protein, partial [Bdellovibrionales bacterium]|nr:mechanosensitive ion channel family protein [Bdellovibrionales bacterium]
MNKVKGLSIFPVFISTANAGIENYLPKWSHHKFFILTNGQWIGLFFIILAGIILEKLVRIYFGKMTIAVLNKRKITNFSKDLEKKVTFPIGIMTFSGIWIIAVRALGLENEQLSMFLRVGYVLFTCGSVMTAHQLVDVLCLYFEKKAKDSDNKFDDILVPLIRKTAKFFVLAIGIIFIGDSLTLDMKGILTGLGIGGLAFALAAKDTISNLFGSLTVLLDRPFRIGDWVLLDGKVEGTVVEVGLRSTRLRTFYNSVITVPNGQLTNIHIDNFGMREYRRFKTTIGVQYDTSPEKLEAFCEGIRQIIINHEYTRKDYFHVYFSNFGSSSLDILVYVFWRVPDWATELNE